MVQRPDHRPGGRDRDRSHAVARSMHAVIVRLAGGRQCAIMLRPDGRSWDARVRRVEPGAFEVLGVVQGVHLASEAGV